MHHRHLLLKTLCKTSLLLTAALSPLSLHAEVTHIPPAPLPDLMTPAQLTKWRAEMTAKSAKQDALNASVAGTTSHSTTSSTSTPFYTGKPFIAETGSYAFKYREYNPEMARWTTVDPSGFPDGANNRVYVNNGVLTALDTTGKQITLYRHEVLLAGIGTGKYHSYIYYNVTDCDGKPTKSTISGEPQRSGLPMDGFGDLVSQPNADAQSARDGGIDISYSAYGWSEEQGLLDDLLGAVASYVQVPYWPIPDPHSNQYNSNGFIHGILSTLGINNIGYIDIICPGWHKPIHLNYSAQHKNDICE